MAESISFYYGRIDGYQEALRRQNFDAGIVSDQETIYYLTGISYHPMERPFFLTVFGNHSRPRLLVPLMEKTHFENRLREVGMRNLDVLTYEEHRARSGGNWYDSLEALLKGVRHLAIEPSLPTERSRRICAYLVASGGVRCEDRDIAEELRLVKDDREIKLLRGASVYASRMARSVLDESYSGVPVAQLFALGRDARNSMFADSYTAGVRPDVLHTNALCAAWPAPYTAMPHYIPFLDDTLDKGPHIAFGFATSNGYWAEVERTYFTEKPSRIERHYYDVMMRARRAAFAVLRPGVRASDVDRAARTVFRNAGLEGRLLHRTGHGIGIEHHEAPFFSGGDNTLLRPGMMVTVEPGIYIPDGNPGEGGYRHSDTILITRNGYEVLTAGVPADLSAMTQTGTWRWIRRFQPLKGLKGFFTRRALNIR